jgi:S1-C subfamily serine protease
MFWQLLLLASMITADGSALPLNAPIGVVTPLDYFDSGRKQVDAYLGHSEALRKTADALAQRCPRIEVRYPHSDDAYQSVLGSGVMLDDRRHVLTAGHLFDGYERGEIRISFPSGLVLSGSLVAHRYEVFGDRRADWALIALSDSGPENLRLQSTALRPGELAFVLGYPDHIGIDPQGEIVFGESSTRFLEPIVTMGTVKDRFTLDPHVGAVPMSGMSGGPVFDIHGRLAGILVSVLRESGRESLYHYRMVPVESVPDVSQALATAGEPSSPIRIVD